MSSQSEPIGYSEPSGLLTAGHSGSDTSQERAVTEARSGTKKKREAAVLRILDTRRGFGLTVWELREIANLHHGQASSVLSTLHKAGLIARLTERRNRCHVYVLNEYVGDRETQAHGRRKPPVIANDPQGESWEAFKNGWLLALDGEEDDMVTVRLVFERWYSEKYGVLP